MSPQTSLSSRGDAANLLLITFDQWRGDWADPYAPVVSLPALKELADQGVTAQRCYTSSPQCVPARLSWITGLYPSQLGVTRNCPADLPDDAPSLVRPLQKCGWHTELIGKTHWTNHQGTQNLVMNQKKLEALGFNRSLEIAGPRALRTVHCELTKDWQEAGIYEKHLEDLERRYGMGRHRNAWEVRPSVLPNNLYPDLWIAEKALERINQLPTTQPWLLWVSFVGPHEPFDTPKPWHGRHRNQELPVANHDYAWIGELPDDCELKKIKAIWNEKLNQNDVRNLRKDYADRLTMLDLQIKRIHDSIRQRNDYPKTAIAITADHGEMLGDGGMLYKSTFLEPSIHVPMIYSPPPNLKENAQQLKKPAALTFCLKAILRNLSKGGGSETLRAQIINTKVVICEFANEILLIKSHKKVCFNSHGDALWATNTRGNAKENVNLIKSEPRGIELASKWHRLFKIGISECARRNNKRWIWRNITKI